MSFRILSHAGLLVSAGGKNLIFDPWLVGSAYWRSWWNYPPVDPALVASLRPDFIYLTHIHWDHFHGPSLRRFSRDTPIFVPRIPVRRMRKDLESLGFSDVRELPHGRRVELAPGLALSAYQFYPFHDSAAVVEAEGVKLLNANDAKLMGPPLDSLLRRHGKFDFVFRSHSSANERICYEFTDAPGPVREDPRRYIDDFANFAARVGARYAIPFASNHCFLHKETFALNPTVVTPDQVMRHCAASGLAGAEVKAMVSGDSWSPASGFAIADGPWFRERDRCLAEYAARMAPKLEKSYALEKGSDVALPRVEAYFQRFRAALPYPARRLLKGRPFTWVLTGAKVRRFQVDLHRGTVRELERPDDSGHPLEIHTSTYIFRRCMALNLFLYLGIGKRVKFRCRREDSKWILFLLMLFNLYECEMLPLRRLLAPYFWMAWLPRWREILLYAAILARRALGRPFRMADYLSAGKAPALQPEKA
jgi:UDP-MurNAc hydroxylase